MTNEKTDRIIREKAEMPYNFTEFTPSDKQRLWKCMERKLAKKHIWKNHWWRYAATLLVFITGTCILYTNQRLTTDFVKNNAVKRTGKMNNHMQRPPTNNSSKSNSIVSPGVRLSVGL